MLRRCLPRCRQQLFQELLPPRFLTLPQPCGRPVKPRIGGNSADLCGVGKGGSAPPLPKIVDLHQVFGWNDLATRGGRIALHSLPRKIVCFQWFLFVTGNYMQRGLSTVLNRVAAPTSGRSNRRGLRRFPPWQHCRPGALEQMAVLVESLRGRRVPHQHLDVFGPKPLRDP